MSAVLKTVKIGSIVLLGLTLLAGILVTGIILYLNPKLPSVSSLKDIRFQVPLRIYTADGEFIGEFGDMKRTPVKYQDLPDKLIKAVIAAEDDRFFDHSGVDFMGIARASYTLLSTGEKSQGGSTITMQVARNFFLSREKSFLRKVNEMLLAIKIDRELSKQEILELYLNKIYLGNHAYGVAAAAQVYYGKSLKDLTLAQIAMLAGLPKAPSRVNPFVNVERAIQRRDYVLERMYELGFINKSEYLAAKKEADQPKSNYMKIAIVAPYIAEMARQEAVAKYGEQAYTSGFKVYTTLRAPLQTAAVNAIRKGILDYDRRHGYRGAEDHLKVENAGEGLEKLLKSKPIIGNLIPGIIVDTQESVINVLLSNGQKVEIPRSTLPAINKSAMRSNESRAAARKDDFFKVGDVVRLEFSSKGNWQLSQLPEVEGSLVSLNPTTGAILALVGGFDFQRSNFNRVLQANRQPGSSFKPFVYSAALEKGFTPASIINDAPVVFDDPALESAWRPENSSGHFLGPTRLRDALAASRNLVSIRLLQAIGIDYSIDYASKFGFRAQNMPRDLTLALGSGAVTSLELARANAVFANGGYLIDPYFIERIEDMNGNTIFRAEPFVACRACSKKLPGQQDSNPMVKPANQIISEKNAYVMTSILSDVIRRGTARKAMELNRNDLAGKTGTTNDQYDAWFAGFNADLVAVTWMGFDEPKALGNNETGAEAALPIWINYMSEALKGAAEHPPERPEGLVSVRIDPETGLLATPDHPNAIFEVFFAENAPTTFAEPKIITSTDGNRVESISIPEQLF